MKSTASGAYPITNTRIIRFSLDELRRSKPFGSRSEFASTSHPLLCAAPQTASMVPSETPRTACLPRVNELLLRLLRHALGLHPVHVPSDPLPAAPAVQPIRDVAVGSEGVIDATHRLSSFSISPRGASETRLTRRCRLGSSSGHLGASRPSAQAGKVYRRSIASRTALMAACGDVPAASTSRSSAASSASLMQVFTQFEKSPRARCHSRVPRPRRPPSPET